MRVRHFTVALAAACLLPTAAVCADPPAVIQIGRESIKEGRGAAHEKVEADWAKTFRAAKYPYNYIALNSMSGPSEVWFISAYPSFAAMEESDKLLEKPGMKNAMEQLEARDGELRASSRSMIAVYRKDLSYRPDLLNLAKTRYMGLSTFRIKMGRMGDFMQGSKVFLDAYAKAEFPLPSVAFQVIAGGGDGMILFFMPMESLKSLDSMPQYEQAMIKAMGEDQFKSMMKGSGEVFAGMDHSYFRLNPTMSYVSKETEEGDPAFWRPKMPAKAAEAKPKEKAGL